MSLLQSPAPSLSPSNTRLWFPHPTLGFPFRQCHYPLLARSPPHPPAWPPYRPSYPPWSLALSQSLSLFSSAWVQFPVDQLLVMVIDTLAPLVWASSSHSIRGIDICGQVRQSCQEPSFPPSHFQAHPSLGLLFRDPLVFVCFSALSVFLVPCIGSSAVPNPLPSAVRRYGVRNIIEYTTRTTEEYVRI
ncbi:hypothetical protein CTAM01_08562 [Colletotrichum tamarilloi]|uniref:Uncharacterized protein n=1 Tax=Colletotrichum tamarilloi TaxID=1209934 RepID=A0ABQ9R5W6_9PEZI|nr:uncharacterized protein CTAM01_08562 [Colletotrichum tamarilloi]KAK1495433.1 hypothetical protein CTAM01_08562 [Colletotrichum tamarilloi]